MIDEPSKTNENSINVSRKEVVKKTAYAGYYFFKKQKQKALNKSSQSIRRSQSITSTPPRRKSIMNRTMSLNLSLHLSKGFSEQKKASSEIWSDLPYETSRRNSPITKSLRKKDISSDRKASFLKM